MRRGIVGRLDPNLCKSGVSSRPVLEQGCCVTLLSIDMLGC